MNLQRLILNGCLVGVIVTSTNINSQTSKPETSKLEVKAELSEALSISCNKVLNFGKVTLPAGDRGQFIVISFADGGGANLSHNNQNVSVDTTNMQEGECTVSGGQASQKLDVTYPDGTNGTHYLTGTAPNAPDSDTFDRSSLLVGNFSPSGADSVTLGSDGTKTFQIKATLQIPANVSSDNMGTYGEEVTVKVSDGL
jgi:hypothetical protein